MSEKYLKIAVAIILVLLNAFSFAMFAADKKFAKSPNGRFPEMYLLFLAFYFGSLGAILAMELLRHKVNDRNDPTKQVFTKVIPISFVIQAAILYGFSMFRQEPWYLTVTAVYLLVFTVIALKRKSVRTRTYQAQRGEKR